MHEKLYNFFVKYFTIRNILILYTSLTAITFIILYNIAKLREMHILFLASFLFASIIILFIAIIARILDI